MPRGNPSPKLAITVDPDVHKSILAAAAKEGVSLSAWMTEAARRSKSSDRSGRGSGVGERAWRFHKRGVGRGPP